MSTHPFPDFIIGGAPRSGTTYLCEALSRHPDIYISRPFNPETKIFLLPDPHQRSYEDRYRSLFNSAGNEHFWGDKTSYYLENEAACHRIYKTIRQVKMVFIVREPVSQLLQLVVES